MKLLLFFVLFVSGCVSTEQTKAPPSEYSSECNIKVEILKSYGDTIRIEYEPSEMRKADKFANDYCLIERQKSSVKNQVSCDGCCKATYLCKSN